MTPQQQAALEAGAGRALTAEDITVLDPLVAIRADGEIATHLSVGRVKVVSRMLSERGVRALPVLPRARLALLQTLKDAQSAQPAWLPTVLTAAGIPAADHPAIADDLASAYPWLQQDAGLDVGNPSVRAMLDLIAIGVPAAASACAALKALGEAADPLPHAAISDALEALKS